MRADGPLSRRGGQGQYLREGDISLDFQRNCYIFPSLECRVFLQAWVAKLADATDLKSVDPKGSCGFDSRPRHHADLGLCRKLGFHTIVCNYALRCLCG